MKLRTTPPAAAEQRQQGVVLVVSLIFLIILSLVSLYVTRGVIVGEQVSKNIRANATATQSAETALRYCEDRVRTAQPLNTLEAPVDLAPGALPSQWQTRVNWTDGSTVSVQIPSDQVTAQGMRPLPMQPRCMVERFSLPPAPGEDPQSVSILQPYLITAVGFTRDYVADANNRPISGGEVWLQSILIP
jgi:type IV pilus assembly protein PilX